MYRYEDNLTYAKRVGTRKGLVFGLGTGLFWAIIFAAFAVSFYLGVVLIQTEGLRPGNVLVVSDSSFFFPLSNIVLLLCSVNRCRFLKSDTN